MRIGLVAPPWYEIPPPGYGGIESLCEWLVKGLITRGHDVTLVGAGRDHTPASFVRTYEEPPSGRLGEALPELVHAAKAARALTEGVDVVHDHSFAGPLLAAGRDVPTVVTAHGPVDGEIGAYYHELASLVSFVAISRAQQRIAPDLPWLGVVYNAIPVDEYPFNDDKDDFALFLGRMSPEKGAALAIDAARQAGVHLVLAGKLNEEREKDYFEREVDPRLGPDVDWIGPADNPTKKDLLARARCLVFPIQWNEPFGIVMVEAMACGTPVVALDGGSVPEVVEHDVTGYVCSDPSELPESIKRSGLLDSHACRARTAEMFDVPRMVEGYESIYHGLLSR
jgi:glycosyltransferase involved in cell wall biosynthesis